jgi:hypothetical protein
VLVYPAFWRRGTDWVPGSVRSTIEALCGRLDLTPPTWAGSDRVPGFAKSSFYELGRQTKASGWLLWLSGIFDSSRVSLWDTLTDRWSENPKYELAQVKFELEVAVAWR